MKGFSDYVNTHETSASYSSKSRGKLDSKERLSFFKQDCK